MGSSPRMRGSPDVSASGSFYAGIIPAHAGLTQDSGAASWASWDHPRACGAHLSRSPATATGQGSSPRMRGSLQKKKRPLLAAGIIPAHAGLTLGFFKGNRALRDHPRACGAHVHALPLLKFIQGSSPRMRGSLRGPLPYSTTCGIIPAHAGLTLKNPNNDAILSVSNPIFYSVLRVIL